MKEVYLKFWHNLKHKNELPAMRFEPPTFGWLKKHQISPLQIQLNAFFILNWDIPGYRYHIIRNFDYMRSLWKNQNLGGPAYQVRKRHLKLLHKMQKMRWNQAFPPYILNFKYRKKGIRIFKKCFKKCFRNVGTIKKLKYSKTQNSFYLPIYHCAM